MTTKPAPIGPLPAAALDERVAIVGTAGSGKTYAAKGWVERLLDQGARVCVVDPLGVWWGLRAAGAGPAFPVVVFGGRHADVPIDSAMGARLGRLIGSQHVPCVVDLAELGSAAARRRFMDDFAEALYETNQHSLHLVLDEADMWAPQRPRPDSMSLLGHIEEIVRRGRVRGFVPWLITQRPAVLHKDVLSQADILIAMKLTSSQDRAAIGGWIEGQADRAEGKRILAALPSLERGNGYIWAPGHGVLQAVQFPPIRTFDSSRTPGRGERLGSPVKLAAIDLSAITEALADMAPASPAQAKRGPKAAGERGANRVIELERELAAMREQRDQARAQVASIHAAIKQHRDRVLALFQALGDVTTILGEPARKPVVVAPRPPPATTAPPDGAIGRAARTLLMVVAQHAPARFTWRQIGTLAGLKATGGHFNALRKQLRDRGLVDEAGDLVGASPSGIAEAGDVPAAPSTPAERLALWCARLPSPAPEILRSLAAAGAQWVDLERVAKDLGKKPTGGHWNSGVAVLRNNGLIEVRDRRARISDLLH